ARPDAVDPRATVARRAARPPPRRPPRNTRPLAAGDPGRLAAELAPRLRARAGARRRRELRARSRRASRRRIAHALGPGRPAPAREALGRACRGAPQPVV